MICVEGPGSIPPRGVSWTTFSDTFSCLYIFNHEHLTKQHSEFVPLVELGNY